MRITYLHQYFNTPTMQGSTRSYEMARRLVERGHEVRMVTSWREPREADDWFVTDEDGIETHWLPVPYGNHLSYPERIRAFFRFAWSAGRHAASLPADVVFATSTPLTIALPGVYAARRQRVPMVFEVRDLWPEMPVAMGALKNPVLIRAAERLEQFAYKNATRVVALSDGMAEGVAEAGYPESRIEVIPNSCDLDLFASTPGKAARFRTAHPELGDGPILLYAGTMGRVNEVTYMVRLAKAMEARVPEARFVILGSGSEEAGVRALAEELGVLGRNLFMYPPTTKNGVAEAFAAASVVSSWVLDLPAAEKNSANKFFDGLAAGRAVTINHGGWQADLLHETGAGFQLERDIDLAAERLESWLTNPERLREAGDAARQLGEERFDRAKLAVQLEEVLQDAVADYSR